MVEQHDGFSDGCSVRVTDCDGIPVVAVRGEVDMCTASLVAVELVAQVNRRPAAVVVDLRAVSFFGSTGINVLLEVYGRALNRKVAIHVVATRPCILKALQVTGMHHIFAVHTELSEALGAVTPIPGNAPATARF
jgi:anti-sigma B factor antagonist